MINYSVFVTDKEYFDTKQRVRIRLEFESVIFSESIMSLTNRFN